MIAFLWVHKLPRVEIGNQTYGWGWMDEFKGERAACRWLLPKFGLVLRWLPD
jgi:hypothetical protein